MKFSKEIRSAVRRYKSTLESWFALRTVSDRTRGIGPSDVLLVCCLRNEMHRIRFFCDYYRALGVNHFLFIDNDSSDGFREWAVNQEDVSVWHTKSSYRDANFGMEWCNYLLSRHGTGHLCVTVDPDEFLVYPHCETRLISDLGQHLKDSRKESLSTVMIDMYSDRPLEETRLEDGGDPFQICPYFDRDGYVQRKNHMFGIFVQGGPRMRIHNRDTPEISPALNKVPVVWWKKHYRYESSTHDMTPLYLNRPNAKGVVSLTGCLFHFKFVASLADKISEEKVRKQHYAGGREYEKYEQSRYLSFFDPDISVGYRNPRQLIELGLMSPGEWF